LYVADSGNNRIRKIGAGGFISTIVGTGESGFAGDGGSARGATLDGPLAVAVDSSNLYIADSGNSRIRRVADGKIRTIAGTGTFGSSGDGGSASAARLNDVFGIVAAGGAVFVADTGNDAVRVIRDDSIATLVGSPPVAGPARVPMEWDSTKFKLLATGWGDTGGGPFLAILPDGRIVYRTDNGLRQRRLSQAGVEYVVRAAQDLGLDSLGGLVSRAFPGGESNGCCGAGLALDVGGMSASWTVTIINERPSPAATRFKRFVGRLTELETWVPADMFLDQQMEPYLPATYELGTSATWDGCAEYQCGISADPSAVDIDRVVWPLDPSVLEFRAFEGCRGVSPKEAAEVLDAIWLAGDRRSHDLSRGATVDLKWPRFAGTLNVRLIPVAPWETACG